MDFRDIEKKLKFKFSQKPLLIGGVAMEFYKLRKGGDDTDFVISRKDYRKLALKYPGSKKKIWYWGFCRNFPLLHFFRRCTSSDTF